MRQTQRGAALIIALVFMVILTVVALSSMHSATFELKVARSVKSQMDVMNASEDALRSGETAVAALADVSAFPNGAGFYQGAALADLSSLDVLVDDTDPDYLAASSTSTSVPNATGKYYVEYLGPINISGNSGAFGQPGLGTRHLYRVTGVGQLSNGQVKVTQSYYATTD